jgi:8-amino-7-oxononanoate synthase
MRQFPKNLEDKLTERSQNNSLRQLSYVNNLIDFSSNDYLGYAKSEELFDATHRFLSQNNFKTNGASGSRLLSGNHALYEITEKYIANFHQQETALIFNSGYDANIGFFGSVPQRNDIILYDELCHASIRDGIKMSNAKAYKFNHNDFEHLEFKIKNLVSENTNSQIYVVTESVFSMDGDTPNLEQIAKISNKYCWHFWRFWSRINSFTKSARQYLCTNCHFRKRFRLPWCGNFGKQKITRLFNKFREKFHLHNRTFSAFCSFYFTSISKTKF